jgi:hypothetical protein
VVGEGLALVRPHELDEVAPQSLPFVTPPHAEEGAAPVLALLARQILDLPLVAAHLLLALQFHEIGEPVSVRLGRLGLLVERRDGHGRAADAAAVEGLHDLVGHAGCDLHRGRPVVDVDGADGVGGYVRLVRDGPDDVAGAFSVEALHEQCGDVAHVADGACSIENRNA